MRAKIIIGRDRDSDQVQALARTVAELKTIDIITFDQLARIGQRIVDLMARELPFNVENQQVTLSEDDIPY